MTASQWTDFLKQLKGQRKRYVEMFAACETDEDRKEARIAIAYKDEQIAKHMQHYSKVVQ